MLRVNGAQHLHKSISVLVGVRAMERLFSFFPLLNGVGNCSVHQHFSPEAQRKEFAQCTAFLTLC